MKGKLRWNVSLYDEGAAVQIVPTPELQSWAEWGGKNADDEEEGY